MRGKRVREPVRRECGYTCLKQECQAVASGMHTGQVLAVSRLELGIPAAHVADVLEADLLYVIRLFAHILVNCGAELALFDLQVHCVAADREGSRPALTDAHGVRFCLWRG